MIKGSEEYKARRREIVRRWRLANREKDLAYSREYQRVKRLENLEESRAKARERYYKMKANPERYQKHLAKQRVVALRRRRANLERARQYTRDWRARQDPEALRAKNRLRTQLRLAEPVGRMRHCLSAAKGRALATGIPFNIGIDDLLPLPSVCPVLGIALNYAGTKARGFKNDSPSIDRIVPSLGYVKGNVCVISWRANRIKQNATAEELRAVMEYVQSKTQCQKKD